MKILGGCACGAVRFEAERNVKFTVNCHCTNCRKAVGGQAVAYVVVGKKGFSFTKGSPNSHTTDTKAVRTFCGVCGSSLTYEADHRKDDIDIVIGSLDCPDEFPPELDYYIDEKVPWVTFQTDNRH